MVAKSDYWILRKLPFYPSYKLLEYTHNLTGGFALEEVNPG